MKVNSGLGGVINITKCYTATESFSLSLLIIPLWVEGLGDFGRDTGLFDTDFDILVYLQHERAVLHPIYDAMQAHSGDDLVAFTQLFEKRFFLFGLLLLRAYEKQIYDDEYRPIHQENDFRISHFYFLSSFGVTVPDRNTSSLCLIVFICMVTDLCCSPFLPAELNVTFT